MRLDFVNECKRRETKAIVGIENPWVQSPRVYNKKTSHKERIFCIGEPDSMKTAQKTVININFFLEHRSEILEMKEQVQLIRSFLAA